MAFDATQKGIYINNALKSSTVNKQDDNAFKGTWNLANNPQQYEIQRTNNFEFYIEGLSTSLPTIVQNTTAQKNAEDVIRISCSKGFVPHFTQNVIEVKRGNNTMKFAGTPTWQAGQIELNDYIGLGTKEVLMAWQRLSYDYSTEKVGLASDYKKDGYLLEYTPDYQLVRTWKLCGCWISGLSEGEFNHESAEKHTIQCTIEYDRAFIDTSDITSEG